MSDSEKITSKVSVVTYPRYEAAYVEPRLILSESINQNDYMEAETAISKLSRHSKKEEISIIMQLFRKGDTVRFAVELDTGKNRLRTGTGVVIGYRKLRNDWVMGINMGEIVANVYIDPKKFVGRGKNAVLKQSYPDKPILEIIRETDFYESRKLTLEKIL